MSRHMRIHTGQKLFKCLVEGCLSTFARQDNVNLDNLDDAAL